MKVKNVKKLRLSIPMSLRDMALKADLSIDVIRRAENGGNVHPVNVRKLAAALGVETKEIMIEEEEATQAETHEPQQLAQVA